MRRFKEIKPSVSFKPTQLRTLRTWVFSVAAIVASPGCGSGDRKLMPLENGLGWTYLAHAGLQSFPDNIRVVRQVPVDAAEGWELEGELGVAHLAWSGGNLITDMMANARFVPPLIVLSSTKEPVRWRGWVDSNGRREPAKATIQREQRKMDLLGQTLETTRSTVDLKISTREVQIQTWFAPGIGIVQQEQRTNRKLNLTLQYLGKL